MPSHRAFVRRLPDTVRWNRPGQQHVLACAADRRATLAAPQGHGLPAAGQGIGGAPERSRSPCFYVASRVETALLEIGVAEGRRVQLAGFKIDADESVRLILLAKYVRMNGTDPQGSIAGTINTLPPAQAIATIYIDRFFASVQ